MGKINKILIIVHPPQKKLLRIEIDSFEPRINRLSVVLNGYLSHVRKEGASGFTLVLHILHEICVFLHPYST